LNLQDNLRVVLDEGIQGPWQLIQLITWIDYGEGTWFGSLTSADS